jgi:hypothetical protein
MCPQAESSSLLDDGDDVPSIVLSRDERLRFFFFTGGSETLALGRWVATKSSSSMNEGLRVD